MTATADLPEYLQRMVATAADLPLPRRHGKPSETARRSAVLILFGEGQGGPDVLLIEKSQRLRSHAGQPAFPGGGADPGEDYPVGTALREAHEEVGVDPSAVRVVATLPELFLGPSDNVVVPVVGWWDDPRDIATGDPHEVARVARVPLADLVDPANRFRVRHPAGYVGPAFGVAGMVVWGFTAGLLDAVLEAAGLNRPWDDRDVRPLAVLPPSQEWSGEEEAENADVDPLDADVADRAAPTVAEDAGSPAAPRTVPGR
ncbi:NUDIX domain-containing protein [Modestobacter sp. DSM 44400]|uniref:NUDIX hydrolase n=1 Tax=Modestobacter sp. DSM 44400 TaxID=1550230 RepID=UPI000898DAF0|nr:CoA pyrophosphatase [Modestobacter sp. DSM 44400]SDY16653.1 NUDIX domain-containing protein [Modestobacter sp. DSM 44400]